MGMSMADFMQMMSADFGEKMSKERFGKLVHSDNQKEVDMALQALERAGGYDNLED